MDNENKLAIRECTLKLAAKWTALVYAVGLVVIVALWVKNDEVPVAESMRILPSSGDAAFVGLPLVLPRLIDPFIMMMPAALLTWIGFDQDIIHKWWTKGEGENLRDAENVIALGWVFGFGGAILVAISGIWMALIGSAIVAAVALVLGADEKPPSWTFSIEVVSAVMFWLIATLAMGTVPGLAYTILCLGVATVVHFGLYYGIRTGYRFITGGFSRTMLSCDVPD